MRTRPLGIFPEISLQLYSQTTPKSRSLDFFYMQCISNTSTAASLLFIPLVAFLFSFHSTTCLLVTSSVCLWTLLPSQVNDIVGIMSDIKEDEDVPEGLKTSKSAESVEENPNVSITICGLHTRKNSKDSEVAKVKRFEEHEYWLSSGPLGMCINTYCMTCPTYCRDTKKMLEKNRRGQTKRITVNQEFHDAESKIWAKKFLLYMHESIPGVVNPHSKFVQWWDRVFLFSCLLATFVDPLFFFLLSVQQENKCVVFEWPLVWVIVVLRSFTDLLYLFHILLQFRLAYISHQHQVVGLGVLVSHPKKIVCNYLKRCFWVDIIVVLPLPQVMTMLVRTTLLLTSANDTKNVLRWVVLFQYLPRLYRFLPMLAGRSTTKAFIFETAWAQFFVHILSFVLAGHLVGSCWYLFGLQRVNQCLKDACDAAGLSPCKKLIDCGHVSDNTAYSQLKTPDEWRSNTRAISCFTEQGFNYGIYLRAVNLTTEHNVVVRYIYSLFWGFHQISTMAGNLSPSYYVWEVLFTMLIVGFGLLLFALLIGNIQNFLQALGRRRMDMMLRRRDVDQWMSHRRLPEEIKKKVRHAEEYNWNATRGVDEEKLLVNLPDDLQTAIRQHLFQFLKKVTIFAAMDEAILDSISERLRHKTYITGCKILIPLGPIKRMTFIVRGEMESIGEDGYACNLSAGDVCGEELLRWCLEDPYGNKEIKPRGIAGERPVSNRTVRCLTNVETFVLGAADLEEVTFLFPKFLQDPHVQKAMRRSLAARRIKTAWRNRKKCLNQSNTAGVSKSLIPFQRGAGHHFRL